MGDMNIIINEEDHWTTKTLKKGKKINHEMLNSLLNRRGELGRCIQKTQQTK